jgi:hypothetical protein
MTENNDTNGNGPQRKRRTVKRSKYSDEGKAKALALLEANSDLDAPLTVTAKQLQIPDATLFDWQKGRGVSENVRQLAEKEKRDLAILFRRAAERGLSDILNSEAPADWRASTGIATFADKFLLLSNQPTAITESRNDATLREDALKSLAELVAACEGDEAKARALLAENAPTLSQYVN